jgi:hypothetical protein
MNRRKSRVIASVYVLGLGLGSASCSTHNQGGSSPVVPVPQRISGAGGDAEKATPLVISAGTNLQAVVLQVELSYASPRSGAVAVNSCMDALAPDFVLGTLYCGEDRSSAQPLTASMVDQVCDGARRQGPTATFPAAMQSCATAVNVAPLQFSPPLLVTLRP